jgi:hypothetical protein
MLYLFTFNYNLWPLGSSLIGSFLGCILSVVLKIDKGKKGIRLLKNIIIFVMPLVACYLVIKDTIYIYNFELYLAVLSGLFLVLAIIYEKIPYRLLHITSIIILFVLAFKINYIYMKDRLIKDRAFERDIRHELNSEITIDNLLKVEKLNLFYDIRNLEGIKYLTNLKELSIYNTKYIKNIDQIKLLHNLEHLEIGGCTFKKIGFIKNLSKLNELELSYVKIDNDYIIPNIKNLKEITLEGIKQKNLSFLNNNTQIESIDLNGCGFKSYKGIEKIHNLKKFKFTGKSLKSEEIEYINKLNTINNITIYFTNFEDIEFLKNITNINTLNLDCHLFVYDITNFYIPSIKNLKELKLESIYSKDFNFAKNVKQIESLTLNDYVLESFKEFNNFKNLKKLKIANSQIRNVDIEYIKDLPLFESIEIINCDIDEADVNRLERLKNIKSFKYEPKQIIEYE